MEGEVAGWEVEDTTVSPNPPTLHSAHPPKLHATTVRKKGTRVMNIGSQRKSEKQPQTSSPSKVYKKIKNISYSLHRASLPSQ